MIASYNMARTVHSILSRITLKIGLCRPDFKFQNLGLIKFIIFVYFAENLLLNIFVIMNETNKND